MPPELLATVLDEVLFFLAVKDAASRRYVLVNEAFCLLVERPREEILGRRDEDLLQGEWADEQRAREDEVLASGQPIVADAIAIATPGRRRVASLKTARSQAGPDGPRLVLSGKDITERVRRQESLAEDNDLLRRVIDTDPSLIFVKDRYGNFVLVNQAMADAFGKSVEEVVNRSNWKLHERTEEMDAYAQVEQEVLRTMREVVVEEDPFTHADGRTRWYRTLKAPLVRASGEVQVLAVCTDVTRLREARQELARRAEEARKEAQEKALLAGELDRKLALIEQQSEEILALSVPMLDVGGDVLGVPIIGVVSAARAAQILDKLLRTVVERQARRVIVDLTGLTSVDTAAVEQLLRIARAVELLGAEVILTGIHPTIAQMIVALGLDLSRTRTLRTLREALAASRR